MVGDSTGAQALKGGTTSIIWEPNYDVHTAAGVANAKEIYGLDYYYNRCYTIILPRY